MPTPPVHCRIGGRHTPGVRTLRCTTKVRGGGAQPKLRGAGMMLSLGLGRCREEHDGPARARRPPTGTGPGTGCKETPPYLLRVLQAWQEKTSGAALPSSSRSFPLPIGPRNPHRGSGTQPKSPAVEWIATTCMPGLRHTSKSATACAHVSDTAPTAKAEARPARTRTVLDEDGLWRIFA